MPKSIDTASRKPKLVYLNVPKTRRARRKTYTVSVLVIQMPDMKVASDFSQITSEAMCSLRKVTLQIKEGDWRMDTTDFPVTFGLPLGD